MFLSRRDMLQRSGTGFGLLGLAGVLAQADDLPSANLSTHNTSPLTPRAPHFTPRAQRVVHLFMNGGPSQVDTFDPKPELTRWHGQPLPVRNLRTERLTGAAMGSPFKFRQHGNSGLSVSSLFEKTARHIDDMCIIRSMQADVPNHEPSLMLMNCGDARLPRPSMGAWVTYGLGSQNQNLPGFIVLCPGGYPIFETRNWRSAFLPGAYQGTHIDTKQTDVRKLIANISNPRMTARQQRHQLDLLASLNRNHLKQRPGDHRLESRIQSFELAFRMQGEAAEAFDISHEP